MNPMALASVLRWPEAEGGDPQLRWLEQAQDLLDAGFEHLPTASQQPDPRWQGVLLECARALQDNAPFHHPHYLAQMQKPPHPVARLAYSLALRLNPNNHGSEGGRASTRMEQEAIEQLATLAGWPAGSGAWGHLCSGGTQANLEALWLARELRPGLAVAASDQAHVCHSRLAGLLAMPLRVIASDHAGRMDVTALEAALRDGQIGCVVATLGSTTCGAVDALERIVELRHRHPFRLHVDASYGGYFRLAAGLDAETRRAFAALAAADTIAIDPHKHGLQPLGCGALLVRAAEERTCYRHVAPYTRLDPADPALGEVSLECSRPGAAAVALWATQRLLPLRRGGEFAQGLDAGHAAALGLQRHLLADGRYVVPFAPQLDVVVWTLPAARASACSARARRYAEAARDQGLHLSLTRLPRPMLADALPGLVWDEEQVVCLRACLMKPEHKDWLESICQCLDRAMAAAAAKPACLDQAGFE
jgi:glutamate/tyrosine decarboxylase-like PLP-dependent enzyme